MLPFGQCVQSLSSTSDKNKQVCAKWTKSTHSYGASGNSVLHVLVDMRFIHM